MGVTQGSTLDVGVIDGGLVEERQLSAVTKAVTQVSDPHSTMLDRQGSTLEVITGGLDDEIQLAAVE